MPKPYAAVYDNGGQTWDRYTVIIGPDAYGMSGDPQSPAGFNQYAGPAADLNREALGAMLQPEQVPDQVARAIEQRGGRIRHV